MEGEALGDLLGLNDGLGETEGDILGLILGEADTPTLPPVQSSKLDELS